jgi:hypothetical protein
VTAPHRPARPFPITASAIDRRRLTDGQRAVRLLAIEPTSRDEAKRIMSILTDGACALQSLDDLGEVENQAVCDDLSAILKRQRELGSRMNVGLYPDVATLPPALAEDGSPWVARAPDPYETVPRCGNLDGSSLSIVVGNIEAGRFCEAHAVTITDGTRSAVYVPLETLLREREGHQLGGT